ncbi:hypothetical protein EJF36_11460 [Bacillus sp. HMF5848]|uniref:YpfB family protein n=1 Tax=Bacillus sp. HMF5848 TaxID=2495421 RepID=UPI000F7AC54C|nr:YpfB family protein [Bacillus sp. HMF5848]RSK27452.1 hypothetical protein EJF36_11460 [Bacillus sp. HMF5848]
MKRLESILIKFVIIQFVFLLIAQAFVLYSPYTMYTSKLVKYEGVTQNNFIKMMETFDQKPSTMIK